MPPLPGAGASRAAAQIAALAAVALLAECLRRRLRAGAAGAVTALHRFAVKGLDRDRLPACQLVRGGCLPSDRRWGLLRTEALGEFDPGAPKWIHKDRFFAACSAGGPLARLATAYDDATETLSVWDRQTRALLLSAALCEEAGRAQAEQFFSARLGENGQPAGLKLVSAADGAHHFGNTQKGVKESGDVRVLHLANLATVKALSAAAQVTLDPLIFRANVLFDGVAPWEEFHWVGRTIAMGKEVRLRVISRTIRCAATCVDGASGGQGPDVPALLQQHFPEHGPYLGVYAQVLRGGRVELGDSIGRVLW